MHLDVCRAALFVLLPVALERSDTRPSKDGVSDRQDKMPKQMDALRRVSSLSLCILLMSLSVDAWAQRASENAVAEASDAFGTAVGREVIGLYTTTSARGFNPSEAGNLRIGGLYFDQIGRDPPVARVVRGSTVHVGISAQGFPSPAPTGVVDFHLRTPGDVYSADALVGFASYAQKFGELDLQLPLIDDVLSVSAGVGYIHNMRFNFANDSNELNAGLIARWRPTDRLTLTPFWSGSQIRNLEQKPGVFIGSDGWPKYRSVDLQPQAWADVRNTSGNSGALLRYQLGSDWLLESGLFRSRANMGNNSLPQLDNVNGAGDGIYSIAAVPARTLVSTSGEARLTRRFETSRVRNTLYFSVKGRHRETESGGVDRRVLGPGSTSGVPQVPLIDFELGPTSRTTAKQLTPGLAYNGVWRGVGQLSLGLQRSFYDRTLRTPDGSEASISSRPWLYNAGLSAFLSRSLALYTSFTRGFEEFADAPGNAVNRDQAVPAQLTRQVDGGLRYQLTPGLSMVAGAFEIEKPYFTLDRTNVYRQVGTTSNRGFEFSLSGALTDRFTVVAGYIYIRPEVAYTPGASNLSEAVAIGPIPGLLRANIQYRPRLVPGLVIDGKIESTSSRYARYPSVSLPAVTTFDTGVRYNTRLLHMPATWRLQLFNLTNEYSVTPAASGQLMSLDGRRFELTLAVDISRSRSPR